MSTLEKATQEATRLKGFIEQHKGTIADAEQAIALLFAQVAALEKLAASESAKAESAQK